MSIINGFLWAFLRRWYGGLCDDNQYPILSNRGLQTIVMVVCLMPLLWLPQFSFWPAFIIAFSLALWVQFQHWSRAVGCILDAGRNHTQSASNYDRWYRIVLDYIYDKINELLAKLNIEYRIEKYKGYYDFWYICMRFGCPLLLLTPLSWWYVVIGLCAAPSYFVSWYIFEKWPFLYNKLPIWVSQPKNMAEIIYGFIFGFGFYKLCLLNIGNM